MEIQDMMTTVQNQSDMRAGAIEKIGKLVGFWQIERFALLLFSFYATKVIFQTQI